MRTASLTGIPARIVITARDRYIGRRRLGVDLRQEGGQRIQGGAGGRQIRVVMA